MSAGSYTLRNGKLIMVELSLVWLCLQFFEWFVSNCLSWPKGIEAWRQKSFITDTYIIARIARYTQKILFSILLNQLDWDCISHFSIGNWYQTQFLLVPNQFINGKYILICCWFNKNQKSRYVNEYCIDCVKLFSVWKLR